MRIEDLQYILEIAQCGSINRAAHSLYMSHSALCYILQQTEADLQFSIFERSSHGVKPTERGEEFLMDAQKILEIANGWKKKDAIRKQEQVNVTLIPVFSRIMGIEMQINLQNLYPDLNVQFQEVKMFSLNELTSLIPKSRSTIFVGCIRPSEDQAFLDYFCPSREWAFSRKYKDSLSLFLSSAHPLSSKALLSQSDLKKLPLLFYPDSKSFAYSKILRNFRSTRSYNISTSEQVIEMVAKNECAAFASYSLISQSELFQSGNLKAVSIQDYPMTMDYYIIYPSEDRITHSEQLVVSLLQEHLSAITG